MNNAMISIYTEQTPNPNSLKFVLNRMLYNDGSAEFTQDLAKKHSPFAEYLHNISYITNVFIAKNFVTLSKDDSTEWFEVIPDIKKEIQKFFETDQIIITEELKDILEKSKQDSIGSEGTVEQRIESALDKYIRPAVEMDGGAVYLHSFENGMVKLMLKGACSGCPSSTITLKSGIEGVLKRFIPEVEEVMEVEE